MEAISGAPETDASGASASLLLVFISMRRPPAKSGNRNRVGNDFFFLPLFFFLASSLLPVLNVRSQSDLEAYNNNNNVTLALTLTPAGYDVII